MKRTEYATLDTCETQPTSRDAHRPITRAAALSAGRAGKSESKGKGWARCHVASAEPIAQERPLETWRSSPGNTRRATPMDGGA